MSVLAGPSRKAPAKLPSKTGPLAVKQEPHDNWLLLSVSRLGLENVPVRDSCEQSYLDREGTMHLSGTGFPYERGSNTYISVTPVVTQCEPHPQRLPRFAQPSTWRPRYSPRYDRETLQLLRLQGLHRRPPRRLGHQTSTRQADHLASDLLSCSHLREAPHNPRRTGGIAGNPKLLFEDRVALLRSCMSRRIG